MGKAKAIIKVGYTCNNNCIFCHAKNKRIYPDLTLEEIKRKILLAKKLNVDMVILSGGEPTIRKDLLDIARFIKKNKMEIGLITNGRRLSYAPFYNELYKIGLRYVYISIHGEKDIHNFLTKAISYNQTLEGIENASKSGVELVVNCVVTKQNELSLNRLIEILKVYRIDKIKFSFPESISKEDYTLTTPDICDASYFVKQAIKHGTKNNLKVGIDGFPLCLIKNYEGFVDNLKSNNIKFISEVHEQIFFPPDKGEKIKFEKCINCAKNKECEGLYDLYFKLDGQRLIDSLQKNINVEENFTQILLEQYKLNHSRPHDKLRKTLQVLEKYEFMNSKYLMKMQEKIMNLEFSVLLDGVFKPLRFFMMVEPKAAAKIGRDIARIHNCHYDWGLYGLITNLAVKYDIITHIGLEYNEENPVIKLYFNRDVKNFQKFIRDIGKGNDINPQLIKDHRFFIFALSFLPNGKKIVKFYFHVYEAESVLKKFGSYIKQDVLINPKKLLLGGVLCFKFKDNALENILHHKKVEGVYSHHLKKYEKQIESLNNFYNSYGKKILPFMVSRGILKYKSTTSPRIYYYLQ